MRHVSGTPAVLVTLARWQCIAWGQTVCGRAPIQQHYIPETHDARVAHSQPAKLETWVAVKTEQLICSVRASLYIPCKMPACLIFKELVLHMIAPHEYNQPALLSIKQLHFENSAASSLHEAESTCNAV